MLCFSSSGGVLSAFKKGASSRKFDSTLDLSSSDSDLSQSTDTLERNHDSKNDTLTSSASTPARQTQTLAAPQPTYSYTCTFGHLHHYMHNRLVPPGQILHLIPCKKAGVVFEKSCFGCFTSINISPGLFWSHLPSCYESAFDTVSKPFANA
jgi:hypothetical protein